MSLLTFQPDAARYYADGYWRASDLWGEFAAQAGAVPGKTALIAGDRRISYAGLESAAVALSSRLAACSAATASRRRSRCSRAFTAARSRRRCPRCSARSSSRP